MKSPRIIPTLLTIASVLFFGAAISSAFTSSHQTTAQSGAIAFNSSYTVRLTVWDANDTASEPVTLDHQTLAGPWIIPAFTMDPQNPALDQPIVFTDTTDYGSYIPDGIQWDFGDGSPIETGNPIEHLYSSGPTGMQVIFKSRSTVMPAGAYCSTAKTLNATKTIPRYREVLPGSRATAAPTPTIAQ